MSIKNPELENYQKLVAKKLRALSPIFAQASIGDFSKNVPLSEEEDEFTDLYVGVQIILEVVREQTAELKSLNVELERRLADQTAAYIRQRAITKSIGEGLIVTDHRYKVILANQAACEILGCTRKDLLHKSWLQVVKIYDANHKLMTREQTAFVMAQRQGKRVQIAHEYYTRFDGSEVPVSVTAAPVKLKGRNIGAVAVFRDITREKEVEKAKDEFVAVASHQLRTPLSIIKWYLQILAEPQTGPLNPKQKEYLGEIEAGSQRMIELVNSLLNVAQIETGKLGIEAESIQPRQIASEVLKDLQPTIRSKNLRMLRTYARELPSMRSDPKLIRSILQNLLTNAVKYTPANGTIRLKMESKPAGTNLNGKIIKRPSLCIRIADTGLGIPLRQQARIFTKLFRADNVNREEVTGTGLGLYITYSVVKRLGGTISFTSEPNRGTTFYVSVPLKAPSSKR